jgi:thiol-disulfide isomerase/thioredoxin
MKFKISAAVLSVVFSISCSGNTDKERKPMEVIEVSANDVTQIVDSYVDKKAVILNVWATWCIPCIEEFPYIVEVRNEFKEDLEVIFISADFPEAKDRVLEFLGNNQVYWQTYLKNDRDEPFIDAVWTEWTGALPATIVYNTEGKRVAAFERPATFTEFRNLAIQAISNP